ncbi:MAG: hypothetical protein KC912_17550 [Proteobacteria bacterium]|nr:hypothetical protein [Pseudomonadota bacterium]
MTRSLVCLAALFSLTACGPSPETELQQFRDNFGPFEDCGSTSPGQCGDDYETEEALAVGACLQEAYDTCTATEATLIRPTVEGDPITWTFFVVPAGEGCDVVRFTDTTQDAFGPNEMTRERCAGVVVGDAEETCPGFDAEECQAELVY